MNRHTQVEDAVKALIQAAVPDSQVRGLDPDEAKPLAIDPFGDVLIRRNEIGDPTDVTMSPSTWYWERAFTLEVAAPKDSGRSEKEIRDAMLAAIGAAGIADRTLSGLSYWLEFTAPMDGEADARGAIPIGWTEFDIIISYATPSPLG